MSLGVEIAARDAQGGSPGFEPVRIMEKRISVSPGGKPMRGESSRLTTKSRMSRMWRGLFEASRSRSLIELSSRLRLLVCPVLTTIVPTWGVRRMRPMDSSFFMAALTVKRETPSDSHSSSSRGSMEPTGQRPVLIPCMSLAASRS